MVEFVVPWTSALAVYVSVPSVGAVLPVVGAADLTVNCATPFVVFCGDDVNSVVADPPEAVDDVFENWTE